MTPRKEASCSLRPCLSQACAFHGDAACIEDHAAGVDTSDLVLVVSAATVTGGTLVQTRFGELLVRDADAATFAAIIEAITVATDDAHKNRRQRARIKRELEARIRELEGDVRELEGKVHALEIEGAQYELEQVGA